MNEFSEYSVSSDGPTCRLHSAPDLVLISTKAGFAVGASCA